MEQKSLSREIKINDVGNEILKYCLEIPEEGIEVISEDGIKKEPIKPICKDSRFFKTKSFCDYSNNNDYVMFVSGEGKTYIARGVWIMPYLIEVGYGQSWVIQQEILKSGDSIKDVVISEMFNSLPQNDPFDKDTDKELDDFLDLLKTKGVDCKKVRNKGYRIESQIISDDGYSISRIRSPRGVIHICEINRDGKIRIDSLTGKYTKTEDTYRVDLNAKRMGQNLTQVHLRQVGKSLLSGKLSFEQMKEAMPDGVVLATYRRAEGESTDDVSKLIKLENVNAPIDGVVFKTLDGEFFVTKEESPKTLDSVIKYCIRIPNDGLEVKRGDKRFTVESLPDSDRLNSLKTFSYSFDNRKRQSTTFITDNGDVYVSMGDWILPFLIEDGYVLGNYFDLYVPVDFNIDIPEKVFLESSRLAKEQEKRKLPVSTSITEEDLLKSNKVEVIDIPDILLKYCIELTEEDVELRKKGSRGYSLKTYSSTGDFAVLFITANGKMYIAKREWILPFLIEFGYVEGDYLCFAGSRKFPEIREEILRVSQKLLAKQQEEKQSGKNGQGPKLCKTPGEQ